MANWDRILRFVFAVIVGFLYLDGIIHGTVAYILFLFAIIILLTSISGYCPIYPMLGWNSFKRK